MRTTFHLLLFLHLIHHYICYNIGTDDVIIASHSSSQGNPLFGYSVAILKFNNKIWALVGAPKDNSSFSLTPFESGAVYSCLLRRGKFDPCVEVAVDTQENNGGGTYRSLRDESWIGNVIRVISNGNSRAQIMTSAPRWINHYVNFETPGNEDYSMNGACYWSYASKMLDGNAFTNEMYKTFPLSRFELQVYQDKYFYKYGQAGVSADIDKFSGDIFIGAPGLMNGAGGYIHLSEGPLTGLGHGLLKNAVFHSETLVDNSYLGYSIAYGKFYGERSMVAVAAYRANYRGEVLLTKGLSRDFTILAEQTLTGPKYLCGYGWAMVASDVTADGYDELFVGAPLTYDSSKTSENGAVYIYSSKNGRSSLILQRELKVPSPGGRFGSAIAAVGDLDKDGYNDIAIGAPLDDSQSGSIFIFRGGAVGIRDTPSQVIRGKSINSALRGFGGSIGLEGVDVDGNGYLDIIVGSSESNQVVVLKSRPVVQSTVLLMASQSMLTEQGELFDITVCVTLNAPPGDTFGPDSFKAHLSIDLDSRTASGGRAHFVSTNTQQTTVDLKIIKGERDCLVLKAQLELQVGDISQPLEVLSVFSSDEIEMDSSPCSSCPILSQNSVTSSTYLITVAPGCGGDNTCSPKLKITPTFVQTLNGVSNILDGGDMGGYYIGSDGILSLDVSVTTEEDYAYQTTLLVSIPARVAVRSTPIYCQIESVDDLPSVRCNLISPIVPGQKVTTGIGLELLTTETTPLTFNIEASAQDVTERESVTLTPLTDFQIALNGLSEPNTATEEKTSNVWYQIKVENRGVTEGAKAVLHLWIPRIANKDVLTNISIQNYEPEENSPHYSCSVNTKSDPLLVPETPEGGLTEENALVVTCPDRAQCTQVTCHLSGLGTSTVTLSTALNVTLLREFLGNDTFVEVNLEAEAEWKTNDDESSKAMLQVVTLVLPQGWADMEKHVPWWVYLLATVGGLGLLIVLVLVLYKCGFFNRNRPPTEKEENGEAEAAEPMMQGTEP